MSGISECPGLVWENCFLEEKVSLNFFKSSKSLCLSQRNAEIRTIKIGIDPKLILKFL